MKFSKISSILAVIIMAFATTSCVDDNNSTVGTASGSDIVSVYEYSPTTVTFSVATVDGNTVYLQAPLNAMFDPEEYPLGSRMYITYNMILGQTGSPILINLTSARPVTTLSVDDATADQCKLDYLSFTVNTVYMADNYINLVAAIEKGTNRTWECLLDTDNSNDRVANLYLITKADKTEFVGSVEVVSIRVANLIASGQYDEIHLHVNNQQSNDFTYKFPATSAN